MKKALLVFLALALIASVAFAEIDPVFSIGSWGRALWNVAVTSGDDIVSSITQSWGTAAPRTAVNVRGTTDNVSYGIDVYGDGSAISLGANAYIEVRPGDWAAIAIGRTYANETRSDAVFGAFNWYRLGTMDNSETTTSVSQEGFIFDSLLDVGNYSGEGSDNQRGGVNARFYPIEGLTIGVQVPLLFSASFSDDAGTHYAPTLRNVWGNANFYASYDISGIGKIRVGYDGRTGNSAGGHEDYYSEDAPIWGIIGAAFELVAVDNFYFAVGAKIPTKSASAGFTHNDGRQPYQANAYASYRLDIVTPLTFHALFGSKIMEYDARMDNYEGFGFQAGVGIDWEVLEGVPVFVDVRYANGVYMAQDSSDNNDCWSFGVGISKQWTNGEIGIAFEGATNGYNFSYTSPSDPDAFVWAIPVKFQYSF